MVEKHSPTRVKPRVMRLEPRMMFDAAGAATAEAAADHAADKSADKHSAVDKPWAQDKAGENGRNDLERMAHRFVDALRGREQSVASDDRAAANDFDPMNRDSRTPEPDAAHIIIVDANAKGLKGIMKSAPEGAEIHVLKDGQNGLKQISEILRGRSGVAEIEIYAEGRNGEFVLAGKTVDLNDLTKSEKGALQRIGASLADDGAHRGSRSRFHRWQERPARDRTPGHPHGGRRHNRCSQKCGRPCRDRVRRSEPARRP